MPLPETKERYTFADYLEWEEAEHTELIDGIPMMMAPPLRIHQEISGELFRQLANHLDGEKCEVYSAPFGVRLFARKEDKPEDIHDVVEPDITIVCDPDKLDKYGCKGAPDMVIEVLSPSTKRHDRLVKLNLYQRAGVREYWIVNPEECSVQVLLLNGEYLVHHEEYGQSDLAKVNILDDCQIDLNKVFSA